MIQQDQDLSALLEEKESSSGSSQSPQQTTGDQPQTAEEALEFSKLSGPAQERFQKMLRRAKEAEQNLEKERALRYQASSQKLPPPPPTYMNQGSNPEIQKAIDQLDQVGIAPKRYVDQKISEMMTQMRFEEKLKHLEEKENGDDGRPKFDRYEYQDFVRQNPQYQYYDPEHVFGIMYSNELVDWEVRNRASQPAGASPLKNTKTFGKDDIWTPEYIDEQIKLQGQGWYEKNFDKIKKVMDASQP